MFLPQTPEQFTYDADGNLLTRTDNSGTTTYTYNVRGQLVSAAGPGGTDTYQYDALGSRISSSHNGVITTNLIDPLSNGGAVVGQCGIPLTKRLSIYGIPRCSDQSSLTL